jgi:ubiquinone/menaquinone biosynthesis C-methylase UbiE
MATDRDAGAPEKALRQLIVGAWIAQAIYAAAKLGVADRLRAGPKTAAELAGEIQVHPESLYRLLRTLVAFGVFARRGELFALNPVGELLLSDGPDSKRALAIMMGEEHFRAWGEILYSLRTGKPAFDHLYGENIFDYLAKHPEQAATFDAAMTGIHGRETLAMIEAYDFSSVHTLVDVGGGNGSLLATVLAQYPAMRGVLFDRPHVIERARASLGGLGMLDRVRLVAGDFFESVAAGGDVYLMRHIIHDWDDQRALRILRNCRAVLGPMGRLLVIENVIPDDDQPTFGKLLDLNMLLLPGGKERTEAEYRDLFRQAGLRLTRVIPTAADVSVIEAVAQ